MGRRPHARGRPGRSSQNSRRLRRRGAPPRARNRARRAQGRALRRARSARRRRRPKRKVSLRLRRSRRARRTLIVTDDWSGYADLRKRGCDHRAIAECGDPEIPEEFLPISHLVWQSQAFARTHHGVSARHLQAYLNEFTFRFNRRFYPFNAFRSLLGIASSARAPTYDELYSVDWAHPTSSGCMS